jgi:DNA polymerase
VSLHLVTGPGYSTWEELEAAATGCTACGLAEGRTQVVFGVGRRDPELMLIGEGPGAEEDRRGEPFVGRAGQLLTGLLADIGLARDDVYIANVVKCRPPGNRDPAPEEIAACRPFLDAQVTFCAPRVIVTLGNFATRAVLGTREGITKLRGRAFPFPGDAAVTVIPTLHPAAVLRTGGAALAQVRADFVRVKRALAAGAEPAAGGGPATAGP